MADADYEYRPASQETVRLQRSRMLDYHDRKRGLDIPAAPRLTWREEAKLQKAKVNALFNAPANLWNGGVYVPEPRIIRQPKIVLAYPYVVKQRDEHADLLAVNGLVPRGLEGREDVCQEIMLAIWEKRITLADLEANRWRVREFVRAFRRENMESSGYAISLDVPRADGRSWYDVLPAE